MHLATYKVCVILVPGEFRGSILSRKLVLILLVILLISGAGAFLLCVHGETLYIRRDSSYALLHVQERITIFAKVL